jgi:hypothetical protein
MKFSRTVVAALTDSKNLRRYRSDLKHVGAKNFSHLHG